MKMVSYWNVSKIISIGYKKEGTMGNNKKQKYKVLDLFCGAGGFSLGFHLAGYDVIGGVEFNKAAHLSHKANFPDGNDFLGDIQTLTDEEVIERYTGVDVIIGGPPCQGFSSANRMSYLNEESQKRNRLFFEFIRFVKLLQPQACVIENVPQILTKDGGFARLAIMDILSEEGYDVNVDVLDASEYGVPEKRRRAFFVGTRTGGPFHFNSIPRLPVVTVGDALSDLYASEGDYTQYKDEPSNAYQEFMRKNSPGLRNHSPRQHAADVLELMKEIPQGGNWKDIPQSKWGGRKFSSSTHSSVYSRADEGKPSRTVTSKGDIIHPHFNRQVTAREAARLQSFPDWYTFIGGSTAQFLQVGNAVPPLLAKAIATELRGYLQVTEEVTEEPVGVAN